MVEITKKATMQICECCDKLKMCKMFLTQMGTAAWICASCRNPKK